MTTIRAAWNQQESKKMFPIPNISAANSTDFRYPPKCKLFTLGTDNTVLFIKIPDHQNGDNVSGKCESIYFQLWDYD